MKKNNKKGFTLIELLAVLVVLAILALIAIPIVIKVINNAREDSYKRSIEGYARAAELAVAQWGLQHPGEAFPTNLKSAKEIAKNYTIDYKGDNVVCQEMYVEENTGLITLRYCQVMKNETEAKSKKYYKYVGNNVDEDTEPIATYEEYSVGDVFTFGGSGYHVIAESGIDQEYVVALKDEPLTAEKVIALGFNSLYTTGGTKQWAAVYYDNTEPYSSDYDGSDVKKVVDKWATTLPSGLKEVRLITYEELYGELDYEVSENGTVILKQPSANTPSWVYSSESSYWTMSQQEDFMSNVWFVGQNGIVDGGTVRGGSAVRPVINVLKSAITKN